MNNKTLSHTGNVGGADCSLNAKTLASRSALRVQLCQALVTAASVQDPSPSLLDTLAGSLQVSFVPNEVVTQDARQACAQALLIVSNLTSDGFLRRSNFATSKSLANVLSLFSTQSGTISAGTAATVYHVDTAVSGLINGVTRNMVGGQAPISFATPNYQLAVVNQRE